MGKVGVFVGAIMASLLCVGGAAKAQQSNFDRCAKAESDVEDALAKAIAACTALLDSNSVTGEDRATIYLNRGISYYHYFRTPEKRKAIADFLKATEISPDSMAAADAYYFLGDLYSFASDLGPDAQSKAIRYSLSALRINPQEEGAMYTLFDIYNSLGDWEKSLNYISRYLELEPKDPTALYYRGETYYRIAGVVGCPVKDPALLDKAMADYDAALPICIANAEACYGDGSPDRIRSMQGEIYVQKGDWDKALAKFNDVLKSEPDYSSAYYGRGLVYAGKGEYAKAIAEYDLALSTGIGVEYHYQRGLAYEKSGDREKAIRDYQIASLERGMMAGLDQDGIGNLARAALLRLGVKPVEKIDLPGS